MISNKVLRITYIFFIIHLVVADSDIFRDPQKLTTYIQPEETLSLFLKSSTKIVLQSGSLLKKSHFISSTNRPSIVSEQQASYSDIHICLKIIEGPVQFYFSSQRSDDKLGKDFIYQELKLEEGNNLIKVGKTIKELKQQNPKGPFFIIAIPKKNCKFFIRYGQCLYNFADLKTVNTEVVKIQPDQHQIRVLRFSEDTNFIVNLIRKTGSPNIKLYECPQQKYSCFQAYNILPKKLSPAHQEKKNHNQINDQFSRFIKFQIKSMLTKNQQFMGKKCEKCNIFIVVESEHNYPIQISVSILSSSLNVQLTQNQIFNWQIQPKSLAKYQISRLKQESMWVTIQVYEGLINVKILQSKGEWKFISNQQNGIIPVQIPRNFNKSNLEPTIYLIQIIGKDEVDSKYSIVYSSGLYEIFLKDGYPTTHLLKANSSIMFIYNNQQLKISPMYLSFNLNISSQFNSLKFRIFYYQQISKQKLEYTPLIKSNTTSMEQTKSYIVTVPGQYPQLQFLFENQGTQNLQITLTLNDEQVIFLPFHQSLPIRILKNGGVNLVVDNNQEGFIQLTIKKCDQSSPKIAYSLSSQDFMKQIYDYQSMGDNERESKTHIKVKKGGGLYIRLGGDGITNSLVVVSAKYINNDHKKLQNNQRVKKGNQGQLSYQLITNSKAQIWFHQLDCSEECMRNAEYYGYWSNSRSDLFRKMICPGVLSLIESSQSSKDIKTEGAKITVKAGKDGIISYKQLLTDSIVYLGIKAVDKKTQTELIYKDIEIVTISGQLSRISSSYMLISVGVAVVLTGILVYIIRRQARLGYTAVRTTEKEKKKKSRLEVVK